jgi:hypothetical protein
MSFCAKNKKLRQITNLLQGIQSGVIEPYWEPLYKALNSLPKWIDKDMNPLNWADGFMFMLERDTLILWDELALQK